MQHVEHPHALGASEVLEKLDTTAQGLSDEQVRQRLAAFGPNEIAAAGRISIFRLLLKPFKSWMVAILMVTAIISWFIGQVIDAYVIALVVLVDAAIGFFQEYRAEKAIVALGRQMVKTARVMRGGELAVVPAATLVPGDIIALEEGDHIPADARLFEVKNLRTVEASLTGESLPVSKHDLPLDQNTMMADRKNMAWGGTFVAGGTARAVVTATGLQTAIGNVSTLIVEIKTGRSHFLGKTDALARQMSLIAFGSAALLFVVGFFIRGFGLAETFMIFIAALVAAVPEGLAAVISLVLAIGARRMAKKNALIREFTATETLGAVTAILTDKTGTLTQNSLVVHKVFLPGEDEVSVTGEGLFPVGNFIRNKAVIDVQQAAHMQQLLRIAAISNNAGIRHEAERDTYELIGDPTEGALLVLARKGGITPGQFKDKKLDDLPFSSQLKLRATLAGNGQERELMVVGAPEKLLEKSVSVLGPGGVSPLGREEQEQIRQKINEWSAEAYRVIGLAYRSYPEDKIDQQHVDQLVFTGLVAMTDPPRKDVRESVEKCRKAGIRVIMVTGDHVNTAIAIARAAGIIDENSGTETTALTEQQLQQLEEDEFSMAVARTSVYARLSPKMKLRIAETLQAQGHLVAMTGDGVNDAPALKRADVGVAMGIMGTDVAREASDVVLADDNFSSIVNAVEQGRIVFTNVRQTGFFLVTTNIAESVTLLLAILLGFPIPLTATQLLWLNLVTDGITDMALATEQGHGDIMETPPMKRDESILNKRVLPFLVINVTIMTILSMAVFMYYLDHSLDKARTGAFITMSLTQLFNVYNLRSLNLPLYEIGLFTNRYINLGVGASLALLIAVTEIPAFAGIFNFEPLGLIDFLVLLAMSSSVLGFAELYKVLHRKYLKALLPS